MSKYCVIGAGAAGLPALKMLLDEGWKLLGCNIGKVIDIDHITDLENARTMIKE